MYSILRCALRLLLALDAGIRPRQCSQTFEADRAFARGTDTEVARDLADSLVTFGGQLPNGGQSGRALLLGGAVECLVKYQAFTFMDDSIVYVKEQMGHSSIQVTVDEYGHLIPVASAPFADRLDVPIVEKNYQQSATRAQPRRSRRRKFPRKLLI